MGEGIAKRDDTTKLKKRAWGDQFAMVAALRQDAAKFIEELDLETKEGCEVAVVCIDERIQSPEGPLAGKAIFRLAGSGILLGESRDDSLNKAVALLRTKKVRLITWHRRCGAAQVAMKKFRLEGDVDDFARDFAMELAKRLGVECVEILLKGSPEFHVARGVVYDGTAGSYKATSAMPDMFVVSRKLIDNRGIALLELGTAVGIAMGHHGFGELFRQQPFIILILGESLEHLECLLEEVTSQVPYLDMKRIEIHGAVVPRS